MEIHSRYLEYGYPGFEINHTTVGFYITEVLKTLVHKKTVVEKLRFFRAHR